MAITNQSIQIQTTEIIDTFAEAFTMRAARVIITADTLAWAMTAAQSMTGFATSIIGCKCEAGIDQTLSPEETLDGRPGVVVLLFARDSEGVEKQLLARLGQCVMTCPTTACFDGLPTAEKRFNIGGQLRYFGDGFQISKVLDGRRFWRIPTMDGEFLLDETFGVQKAIGGGNLLILGRDSAAALAAASAAVEAMRAVPGVIMPFPGGLVRSGSKVGSQRYKFLFATTNDAYCPTLRAFASQTKIPDNLGAVYEIVIDGLTLEATETAMSVGIEAAIAQGAAQITASNFEGKLGQYQISLHPLVN